MDELNSYRITFKPISIIAKSPEDAESKAQDIIGSGEVEIKDVIEI